MPAANVTFILPDPALRWAISAYYFVEPGKDGAAIRDLLHPEWANIRMVLGGVWKLGHTVSDIRSDPVIFGPSSHSLSISGEGGVGMGIGLLPAGWAGMIDAPAASYADTAPPLSEVMGEAVAATVRAIRRCADHPARAAALDRCFLARMSRRPAVSPMVARAHGVLMSPDIATAEDFAGALGLSTRQTHRLSLRMFGFAPKLLLQRQRFLRTLAVLRLDLDRPWAEQIDDRYYDQSHFVRDFHRFMDMSPTEYFSLPREMLEPAAIARTAHLGQPLQALQPPA